MDRRPIGASVPPHRGRHRLARDQAIAARARIVRRLIAAAFVLLAAAVAVWLAVRPAPTPGPHLLVGVDDDLLKWTSDPLGVVRWQHELGARAVRVWVPWAGESRPSGGRLVELARTEEAARQTDVVLAVFGFARDTPTNARSRARYCGYARSVLALVPDARAIVVWNEANAPAYWSATPSQYAALLAHCYDVLHRSGLTILDSTASAHAPEKFLRAVGAWYRASGRKRRLVDAFGHNPYPATGTEQPDAMHAPGFVGEGDYSRLVGVLQTAFGYRPDIWYLEDGFQSTVPPRLRSRYSGNENVPTMTPAQQARMLGNAVILAACQPNVHAFFNFELVDESRLSGWQSGLVWRSVHRKPAAAAFQVAARQAASGCP